MKQLPILFTALLIFLFSYAGYAQWRADTITGGVITLKNYHQYNKEFAFSNRPDGILQVFEQLVDNANGGTDNTIKVQRIDSFGVLRLGTADSGLFVAKCDELLDAIDDSTGGSFILYYIWGYELGQADDSMYLYLQHINIAGQPLWGTYGKLVTRVSTSENLSGKLCGLPAGNVAVVWGTPDNDGYGQLYAQKYSQAGTAQWNAAGVLVCAAAEKRGVYHFCHDGTGGLLIVFEDGRNGHQDENGNYDNLDIYFQHVSLGGVLLAGANGVPVSTGSSYQTLPEENSMAEFILPDGAGGCYFLFFTDPDGTDVYQDRYVQRLNSSGQVLWANPAFIVRSAYLHSVFQERFLSNSAGGVLLIYLVCREDDIYENKAYLQMQAVNTAGAIQYPSGTGKFIAPAFTAVTREGSYAFDAMYNAGGEMLLVFKDADSSRSMRLQKMAANGMLTWDSSGKTVIRQNADRLQLINARDGNTLLMWSDGRNYIGTGFDSRDIFAARFDPDGNFSQTRLTFVTVANGDWNDPATWFTGVVPGPGDKVLVTKTVTVSAAASCYSLQVVQPGSINVLNGAVLTVLH